MQIIKVGEQFEEGRTQYSEGGKFDIDDNGAIVFIAYKNPTQSEIDNISKGRLQIGIFAKSDIIFMLFKFGDESWMDMPYTVHLSKNLTELKNPGSSFYGLNIFLVDADSGIVKAIRFVSIPNSISRLIYEHCQLQKANPFSVSEYNSTLIRIYASYETKELVRYAKIERISWNDSEE